MTDNEESHVIGWKSKAVSICAFCNIHLSKTDDPDVMQCKQCSRRYLPKREVIAEEDEMVSVHEEEQVELAGISDGSGLLVEGDNDDLLRPKIERPNVHLKPGEQLVDYQEEIPDPDSS